MGFNTHVYIENRGSFCTLDQETFDLLLDRRDLRFQLRTLVNRDRTGDDGTGHATGTTQSLLRAHEHVGHVLVLAEQWQVEQDLQGFSIGGHHDELGQTAVQRLGGLVGTLAQLLVVQSLLDEVHDLRGERGVGQGECLGVNFLSLRTTFRINYDISESTRKFNLPFCCRCFLVGPEMKGSW